MAPPFVVAFESINLEFVNVKLEPKMKIDPPTSPAKLALQVMLTTVPPLPCQNSAPPSSPAVLLIMVELYRRP